MSEENKQNADKLSSDIQLSAENKSAISQSVSTARKFEIELYEEVTNDNTGEVTSFKKVKTDEPIYITANSSAELKSYAQKFAVCGQRMKIVREINLAPTKADTKNNIVQSQTTAQTQTVEQQKPVVVQAPEKHEVKYYRIGGIDIKDDNGKIYQKQWMRLTDAESKNIRIVNDKNNALVNLNGKHIEMMKWTLVENSTDDDNISLEEDI